MRKKETNIDITIEKKEDYQNQFNHQKLSKELSNYIDEEYKGMPINNHIRLTIHLKCQLNEDEKTELKTKIHKNYQMRMKEEQNIENLAKIFRIVLLFLGIRLLTMSHFIETIPIYIASEIIDVVAWVAIWEVAYNYFFEKVKKQVKIKRLKKLTNCIINFVEETSDGSKN